MKTYFAKKIIILENTPDDSRYIIEMFQNGKTKCKKIKLIVPKIKQP